MDAQQDFKDSKGFCTYRGGSRQEGTWKSKGSFWRGLRCAQKSTPRSLREGLYSTWTAPAVLSPAPSTTRMIKLDNLGSDVSCSALQARAVRFREACHQQKTCSQLLCNPTLGTKRTHKE